MIIWDKAEIIGSSNKITIKGSDCSITGTKPITIPSATITNLTCTNASLIGTFSGTLNNATGTFSGELRNATGTFKGRLNNATGTFSGTLHGSFNGTFTNVSGTLSTVTFTTSINIPAGSTINGEPITAQYVVGSVNNIERTNDASLATNNWSSISETNGSTYAIITAHTMDIYAVLRFSDTSHIKLDRWYRIQVPTACRNILQQKKCKLIAMDYMVQPLDDGHVTLAGYMPMWAPILYSDIHGLIQPFVAATRPNATIYLGGGLDQWAIDQRVSLHCTIVWE